MGQYANRWCRCSYLLHRCPSRYALCLTMGSTIAMDNIHLCLWLPNSSSSILLILLLRALFICGKGKIAERVCSVHRHDGLWLNAFRGNPHCGTGDCITFLFFSPPWLDSSRITLYIYMHCLSTFISIPTHLYIYTLSTSLFIMFIFSFKPLTICVIAILKSLSTNSIILSLLSPFLLTDFSF